VKDELEHRLVGEIAAVEGGEHVLLDRGLRVGGGGAVRVTSRRSRRETRPAPHLAEDVVEEHVRQRASPVPS
jgi:hypothetical protein